MKLWLLLSAVASILATFNAHAINNCQELMRVIRHADFQPSITKVLDYNVLEYGRPALSYWIEEGRLDPSARNMLSLLLERPLVGSLRRLYCYSDVRYSDSTAGSVQYVLDRDADGEQYWQLADFDRMEWQEWVAELRKFYKSLNPERPWHRMKPVCTIVGHTPICPGCTVTIPKRECKIRPIEKPSNWLELPRF